MLGLGWDFMVKAMQRVAVDNLTFFGAIKNKIDTKGQRKNVGGFEQVSNHVQLSLTKSKYSWCCYAAKLFPSATSRKGCL